jgi:glycosyltransferase involved in cell wall biosynthesis
MMARRLTVLITNIWLADFGGSEVVVRDTALGLLRRGHRPIVYSPTLGPFAADLATRGVAVIDDLRQLGETPDIIHGHHCIPCGEALIRFPDVPAIDVCHAFEYWVEAPVHFPQIGAYVAVDETCRDRLVHTEGIDPARVLVIPNAVDLERVPPRPAPLAERPRRAAAFYKAAAAGELRSACERAGIAFDTVGWSGDNRIANPERQLVHYDLVFATARAALEAMCCGCAVIVADGRGFHGLVTPHNFDALRAMNFGLRSLTQPVTVDRCLEEIARYNRDDAAAVTARAREVADLTGTIEQYERLYEEVISGARRPVVDEAARKQAEARFLHDYLPRRPGDGRWPWLAERERLHNERSTLRQEQQRLQQEQARLQREVNALRQAVAERDAIVQSRSRLLKQFWRIATGAK